MQIIKVPGINGLGKTGKARNAGNAIIEETGKGKLLDIEEIHVDNSNIEEQEKLIYENAKQVLENGKAVFLGGDHSISYSIGKAFLDNFGNDESFLIVFDAHADLMPSMKEPTHEEWLRALIGRGWKKENIILVGVRKIENQELAFLKEKGIKYFEMNNIENKEDVCDAIMEASQGKNLYISFDIDVVDPAFAPGTGYKEPGGFSSREILYFAKRLSKLKNLKVVDIVEVFEKDEITAKLAAKILGEFI